VHPAKILHPFKPHHLNVFVALVIENGASDEEQHENPQAILQCEASLRLLLIINWLLQLIGPTKVLLI